MKSYYSLKWFCCRKTMFYLAKNILKSLFPLCCREYNVGAVAYLKELSKPTLPRSVLLFPKVNSNGGRVFNEAWGILYTWFKFLVKSTNKWSKDYTIQHDWICFLRITLYVCVPVHLCACECMHATLCLWKSEASLRKGNLTFHGWVPGIEAYTFFQR